MVARSALLVCLMLILTGCFRQNSDSFESVNSQDTVLETPAQSNDNDTTTADNAQVIVPERTDEPVVIVQETVVNPPTESQTATEEAAPTQAEPVDEIDMQPTIIIISPRTNDEEGDDGGVVRIVPTATRDNIITPQAPSQINFPTPTPGGDDSERVVGAGLFSTPTDIFDGDGNVAVGDDCSYEIERGDTLFGLALRYGVSLADILELNRLSEDAVIQPGDTIMIPDCGANTVSVPDEPEATEDPNAPTATPTATPTLEVVEEGIVHLVQSGETLYNIAIAYGVTVRQIVDANELADPNRLALNQRLIIPITPTPSPTFTPAAIPTRSSTGG